jgi:dienelactone hydrolase
MRVGVVLIVCALFVVGCGSTQHVTITAMPRSTLIDQTVAIRVHGAKPGSLLSLRLVQGRWAGRGVYRVRPDGSVDVTRDRPVSGTYSGRDAMGLFWSMVPSSIGTTASSPFEGGQMALTASVGGKQVATTTIVRRYLAAGVVAHKETLARTGFYGIDYVPPAGRALGAPVLDFGGSEGGLYSAGTAALLAAHGHPALAIAYFDEPGLPQSLERIPLGYFARAARWLDRQPGVDPKRLVVWGTSYGSEAALELGVHYPALVHGVIAAVPSSVASPGLTATDALSVAPAWTVGGRAIAPGTIPVERIRGPIFAFGGAEDALWPSYLSVPDVAARSTEYGGPPVTAVVYPSAGHAVGVAVPNLPGETTVVSHGMSLNLGGSPRGDQAALVKIWPRLLHFLAVVPDR